MSNEHHRNFADAAAALRRHYGHCEDCDDGRMCATAVKLWDQASIRFTAMVRSCAAWHARKDRGRDRVDKLLRKMERALRFVED